MLAAMTIRFPATRQWTFRQNLLQPCSETVCLYNQGIGRRCTPFHVKSAVILQRRNGVRDYNPYKVNGQDYTGKIYVPYLANIPNGTATLKFILQNINFTITEKAMTWR